MILLRCIYAVVCCIIPTSTAIKIPVKIAETIRLTRPQNIPVVLALSIAGANTICSRGVCIPIIPMIESTLIMSNSMVLNDICDIEADRINSPDRPLVKGTVTKPDAIRFSLLLSFLTETVNLLFMHQNMQWIIHIALLYIHLYTPVLKRIPVIKNIACAGLVGFSVLFSGILTSRHTNRGLLYITANVIFGGSWVNEILLDMRDYQGDRLHGIRTLATLYGKQTSWTIAYMILYINMMMNIVGLLQLRMNPSVYLGIMIPQLFMLRKIQRSMFSTDSIQSYLKHTTKTMMAILFYILYKRG